MVHIGRRSKFKTFQKFLYSKKLYNATCEYFFIIQAKGRITTMAEMTAGGHEKGLIRCSGDYMGSRRNAYSFRIVGSATEARARIVRSGTEGGMIYMEAMAAENRRHHKIKYFLKSICLF